MSLGHKILALLLVVAAAPLVTVGFLLINRHEQALVERLRASQTAAASEAARALDDRARERIETFARLVRAGAASLEEAAQRQAVLEFTAGQLPEASAALLLSSDGVLAGHAVARGRPGAAALEGEALKQIATAVAAHALPRLHDVAGGVVAGPILHLPGPGLALAPVVVDVGGEGEARRFGVALLLVPALCERALDAQQRSAGLLLVDPTGRAIWPQAAVSTPVQRAAARAASGQAGSLRVDDGAAVTLIAFARVKSLGAVITLSAPESRALAPAARLRTLTLSALAVAVVIALLFGVLVTRRLRSGVDHLDRAARKIGQGDLGVRVALEGDDELGRLAGTMNQMVQELAAARDELEAFNRELQQRVEERTSELKLALEKLHQTSKLAAVGQLGAGLAHELNNPLSGILGYSQSLLRKTDEEDPTYKKLNKIEGAAKRCTAITKNLLRLAQDAEVSHREEVEPSELVERVQVLVGAGLRQVGVELELEVEESLPGLECESGAIAQVLVNLLENAGTAVNETEGASVRLRVEKVDGGLAFTVEDNGRGIAEENLGRVFEPFYTTKEDWGSIGLGLSVAYRIVDEHGGTIDLTSKEGEGTTARVFIPFELVKNDPVPEELRART